ncbi:MAG: DUF1501 domain-containing protein [Cocleimonas sp.]
MLPKNNLDRRNFLKLLAKGGGAAAFGHLSLLNESLAASENLSGYKALVCVFLRGGNDSFNMIIPSKHKDYAIYKKSRGELAVNNKDLGLESIDEKINNGSLGKGANNPYNVDGTASKAYTKGYYDLSNIGINLGVNGVMPELAQLITNRKASIIANIGNLVTPVTRSEILKDSADLPLFLFAHNHQQRALQTGQGNNLNDVGWAGKIADNWADSNDNTSLGLNFSYSGNNRMLIGKSTAPLVLRAGDIPIFSGMAQDTNELMNARRSLFRSLSDGYSNNHPLKSLYSNFIQNTITRTDILSAAWNKNDTNFESLNNPYGEQLFNNPSAKDLGFKSGLLQGSLLKNLESIAKMIDVGAKEAKASGKAKRQIFYVNLDRFDNHNNQADTHPRLLRELSIGLWSFQKALETLQHEKEVTTFTMSDFGRTLTPNTGHGTDHAWGGNQIVMGGAGDGSIGSFNGGRLIGDFPDLTLGGINDTNNRGRIIPTIAQDQLNATICNWFGVDKPSIASIFPNAMNFGDNQGDISSAFLDNFFVS